ARRSSSMAQYGHCVTSWWTSGRWWWLGSWQPLPPAQNGVSVGPFVTLRTATTPCAGAEAGAGEDERSGATTPSSSWTAVSTTLATQVTRSSVARARTLKRRRQWRRIGRNTAQEPRAAPPRLSTRRDRNPPFLRA